MSDIINEIEALVDSRDDWIEKNSYLIKFMLLQTSFDGKEEKRIQRYCEEFMNPHFLGEVFEKFDGETKLAFTIIVGEIMLDRN